MLAPVDFDLTFDYETFVNTVEEDEKFGARDLILFDNWTLSERYEFESALGGDENMANFKYDSAIDSGNK